jgi:FtsP/CotA-like multicopper oxidase with cupredoxin domain
MADTHRFTPPPLSRRSLLGLGGLAAGATLLGACDSITSSSTSLVSPHAQVVAQAEARRRKPGAKVVDAALTLRPQRIDLGGPVVDTWAFGATVPGPTLRVRAGDVLRVAVSNALPAASSVHWHGIALRNDMDGAADLTQKRIPTGGSFRYEFTVPDPGTYWYHPHVGVQLDRGLYGPLIVDDPHEPGGYDVEFVVVLDDWLDGTGTTPDAMLAKLRKGMSSSGMGDMNGMNGGSGDGMSMSGMSSMILGGDAGDIDYPHYLVNGRVPTAPVTLSANPGQRARIRLVNAGGDTAFRVALGGHRMTVTHTDGFPVSPVDTDALLVGMGERYDVRVTLTDGVFPLVAVAEGKKGQGLALVRTGAGTVPPATVRPAELDRKVAGQADLTVTEAVRLSDKAPDRTISVDLTGTMSAYDWGMHWTDDVGASGFQNRPFTVRQGERVRLRMVNQTTMFHPMHLHGHTFQVRGSGGAGARKDTVIVLPKQTVTADLVADNPGQWRYHCHNVYHGEAGMMGVLAYQQTARR